MKKILLAAALALGLTSQAFGQAAGTPPFSYTGTEQLRCTDNAGQACNILLNQVRNTIGYILVSGGTTINTAASWYQANVIATGAITTWNVTLPNPAPDGMDFSVTNSTAAAFTTNVNVTVGAGVQTQILAVAYASQTLAANGGSAEWEYSNATSTWYRIR